MLKSLQQHPCVGKASGGGINQKAGGGDPGLRQDDSTEQPDQDQEQKENDDNSPVWITFRIRDTAHQYDAMLFRSRKQLVLPIPAEGLPEGSKEAITELLEFAEESLQASEVIVSLNKERQDRLTVIRTLMYLGFESLGPENSVVPAEVADPQQYFMLYSI